MNKNLFLGMFATASMLLATSCSNDELSAVQSGNEAQVTFSLGLEGSIASRVISDGTGAKQLVYAVYKLDESNNNTPVLQKVIGSDENGQFVDREAFDNGLTETVSITLAKGQTYQVAFWAQNPECGAYTTSDLQNVIINYTNATNNNEVRDAFFKTVEFTVSGNQKIDVELKRPFAQINVGVYKTDWDAAVASGIEIENSKVVINNAATSINLLTGAVDGETTVTYALEAIPNEELKVDTDGDGNKETYKWLSMSYILVYDKNTTDVDNDKTLGDARATLNSLEFTFDPKSGNDIVFNQGLTNVPVQRNWRTNILGQILTGNLQFNITINPAYDDDYNFPLDQLEDAFANGGEVTLFSDVTLPEDFEIPAGKDVKINLNGFNLNVESLVDVYGNLQISNGNMNVDIEGQADLKYAFVARNGATVDIEEVNMTVADKSAGVLVPYSNIEATINISNTTMTIAGNGHGISAPQGAKNLNINVTKSTLTGKYALYLMQTNSTVKIDEESKIDEFWVMGGNVTVAYEGEKPEVKTDGLANTLTFIPMNEYLFKEAMENGGQITLTEDVTLSSGMTVAAGANAEIALDNNTLTVANQNTVLGKLTISGGEVDVNVPRTDNSTKLAFLADNGSVINVKDAIINVAKGNMAFAIFNEDYQYRDIETTINIENSTISGEGRGIVSPFGAKSVEINLINSSVHEIYLESVQEAVITIDATSTANIAIEGTTKLTVKHPAGHKPTVSGAAANITFVEI